MIMCNQWLYELWNKSIINDNEFNQRFYVGDNQWLYIQPMISIITNIEHNQRL